MTIPLLAQTAAAPATWLERAVLSALVIAAVSMGPYFTVSMVWGCADIFSGLMAFPNLLALIVLSPVVVKCTREYFGKDR